MGSWATWRDGVKYNVKLPGDPQRRTFYGRTDREAYARAQAAYLAIVNRTIPISDKDVHALISEWLACHVPVLDRSGTRYVGWKPSTYETNDNFCRRYILPELGAVPLSELTVLRVDEFLRGWIGKISESSRDHIRSILCQVCEWAVGRDIIPKNYAKYTTRISVPEYQAARLDLEQCRRLIDAAWAHPLGGVVIIAIATGMRQGEILGATWSKVTNGELHVDTTLTRVRGGRANGGGLMLSPTTKTHRSRDQQLTPLVERVLEHRRAAQIEERRICPPWRWHDTDFIFTTSVGTPVESKNFLTRVWYPMLAVAGLPRIRFHDLRHSHATMLRVLGYDLKDSGAMLGQTEVRTTSHYTEVTRERKREIARHVEQALLEGSMDTTVDQPPAVLEWQEWPG